MPTLHIRYPWPTKSHQAYGTCALCGPKQILFELRFTTGTQAPVADETLTGGTSGDTGVVNKRTRSDDVVITELVLESGTWAGGDAAGFVVMKDCTGVTDDEDDGRHCFSAGESVTGDSGAAFTTEDVAVEKVYMIPWPKSKLYKYEGKWYCPYHFRFRSHHKELDKEKINLGPDPDPWEES